MPPAIITRFGKKDTYMKRKKNGYMEKIWVEVWIKPFLVSLFLQNMLGVQPPYQETRLVAYRYKSQALVPYIFLPALKRYPVQHY